MALSPTACLGTVPGVRVNGLTLVLSCPCEAALWKTLSSFPHDENYGNPCDPLVHCLDSFVKVEFMPSIE